MIRRLSIKHLLRPLPLASAAMLLLLVLKVMSLLQGAADPSVLVTARQAVFPVARAASEPPAPPHPSPVPQGPVAPPPSAAPVTPADPPPSAEERALFGDLRARRAALDARANSLGEREALVAAAERRLTQRVDELAALQTRLEQLEQTRRERDEANWRSLVKTYETMRPRDAAVIFNDLEQPVLMQMLDRMKEAKAAAILAAMQPERARAATSQLAQWRTRAPTPPGG